MGCENARPDPGEDNRLFDSLYSLVFSCRDGYGGLRWDIYLELLDLEDLSRDQKRLHIRKALRVERLVAKKQADEMEKKTEEAERHSPRGSA